MKKNRLERFTAWKPLILFFRFLVCIAAGSALLSVPLSASDWLRFRGPNGTGVVTDINLPDAIDRDKNVLWSIRIPPGNSSPVVHNGLLFITAHEGDKRILYCHNAKTGEMVWERSIIKARTEIFNRLNGPTTPSPVTDGRRVFVFFPEFGILAYDYKGRELWRMPMGPFASIQGLAASPIYVDGKVVLLIDTVEEAYLSAFDAGTGKQIWKIDRPVGMLGSYATPTVYEPADGPAQVVVAGAVELTGYEVNSGDRIWWVHGLDVFPTAPPFVLGDSVYTVEPAEQGWPAFGGVLRQFDTDGDGKISFSESAEDLIWTRSFIGIDREVGNGDGMVDSDEYSRLSTDITGGGLTRIRVTGKGDVSETHIVWRHTRSMPSMAGALLYHDVLYVVRKAVVTTFDPNTGELLRRERLRGALGDYYASPVAGDGKIYLVSLDGKTTVLRAGREWQTLATGDLGEQVIATPAIAEGRVFIRTESTFYCFGN